jgi:hypothetical protein
MLDDLRKKRDEEKTLKKKKQLLLGKPPGQTTLGFAGAQMMGFGNTIMNSSD